MENVPKYLCLLETLKFADNNNVRKNAKDIPQQERFKSNLDEIQKVLKLNYKEIVIHITNKLQLQHLGTQVNLREEDQKLFYALLLQDVVLTVILNTKVESDAKEDLISTKHVNLLIKAVQELGEQGLRNLLHPSLCQKGSIFYKNANVADQNCFPHYALLQLFLEFFAKIFEIKRFRVANAMDEALRYYMAAIYTLLLAQERKEIAVNEQNLINLQGKLNYIWSHVSKVSYFHNVLLLKALPQLPETLQKKLHQELLRKLIDKDGFSTLVITLMQSGAQQKQPMNDKQTFEIISHIVSFRGHSQSFQKEIILQIFKFLQLCQTQRRDMEEYMGAGLLSLRRLYDLNEKNKKQVCQKLEKWFQPLCQPTDLLTGLIVMEHEDFFLLIAMLYQLFCTSIVECLPSALLVNYLPVLLQLYYLLPAEHLQKQQIAGLIMRCLNNRSEAELKEIVEHLYTRQFSAGWSVLHERLMPLINEIHSQVTFKVASSDCQQEFSIFLALPELLIRTEFHPLTYRIFMLLLQLISDMLLTSEEDKIGLLQTEEELIAFLNAKYPVKVEILLSLNTLISHEPLKTQISIHNKEFLEFLRTNLEQRVAQSQQLAESSDQILLVLLTLTEELLTRCSDAHFSDLVHSFLPSLRRLRAFTPNQLVQQRIDSLLHKLQNKVFNSEPTNDSTDAFQQARQLIETLETPHLQVYGIQMLLDLLRHSDPVTLANGHVIVALALHTLKSKDSYTFLNCVRLFVALVHVMEGEVLELLSDEYLNDNASADFRLVVGEAILKVSQELGPLNYKYKDVLLNGFMQGARSPLNEFRMSAFANLAQLCRTLSYQVYKFFQELLNLIDCELTTGSYLPAKRAAVLVLSDLLEGMDNLWDFEEMLLPIYRLLKVLVSDKQGDEKMRLHAANGLKVLAEKCKKLLMPAEERLEKEIKIIGIKDKPKRRLKGYILEMN